MNTGSSNKCLGPSQRHWRLFGPRMIDFSLDCYTIQGLPCKAIAMKAVYIQKNIQAFCHKRSPSIFELETISEPIKKEETGPFWI